MAKNLGRSEESASISRHMRYALIQNSIVQKGEYPRKLREINWDHKRKACEILQGRSQAVRDHVINFCNSSLDQSTKRKPKTFLSRDRVLMGKISELSSLYLPPRTTSDFRSYSSSNLYHQTETIDRTSQLRSSLTSLLMSTRKDFFRTDVKPLLTDSSIEGSKLKVVPLRPSSVKNDASVGRDRKLSNKPLLSTFQNVQPQQATRRWTAVSFKRIKAFPVQMINKETENRPGTTAGVTLPIRRRSCQFSSNAKLLLQLQKTQQFSRMDSKNKQPRFFNIQGKRIKSSRVEPAKQQSILLLANGIRATKEIKTDNPPSDKNIPRMNFSRPKAKFSDSQSESKWKIVKELLGSKKLQSSNTCANTHPLVNKKGNDEISDDVLKSTRPAGNPSSRKRSVWWSDELTHEKNKK